MVEQAERASVIERPVTIKYKPEEAWINPNPGEVRARLIAVKQGKEMPYEKTIYPSFHFIRRRFGVDISKPFYLLRRDLAVMRAKRKSEKINRAVEKKAERDIKATIQASRDSNR